MFDMNEIPVYRKGIEIRDLGDEIIIISTDSKLMHTLVDTGRFIWEAIDGINTIKEILNMICSEYNVKKDQAQPDLFEFLNMLKTKKLIDLTVEE